MLQLRHRRRATAKRVVDDQAGTIIVVGHIEANSSHVPFISYPNEIAKLIQEAADC